MQAPLMISASADVVEAWHVVVDFAAAVAVVVVAAVLVVVVTEVFADLIVVFLRALKPQIGVLETSVRPEGSQEAASECFLMQL